MLYSFDRFTLDTEAFELRLEGEPVAVEPQVFELLAMLVEHQGRVVTKDEILERVWNGRIVSEATLSSRVKAARQAINDDGTAQRLIRTIHGRGFRFVGGASPLGTGDGAERTASMSVAPQRQDAPTVPEPAEVTRLTGEVMHRPVIAVLPFADASGSQEDRYFADGLTEELIAAMSAWRWFPVISRNTAFLYRGVQKPAKSIGAEIGARYLLTGVVRRRGLRVRVKIALVDAEIDRELWTERFDREQDDLFALQDELSARIMQAVEPEIRNAEYHRVLRKAPGDFTAWDLAMRALWHVNRRTADDYDHSEALACKAAARDPGWSFPHEIIAFARFERAMMGWSSADARSAFSKTLEAARAALDVDANSWLAHALSGVGELWTNLHYDRALGHLHRAIELNPSASWSYHFCGCISGFAGDLKSATFNQEMVFKVDPVYPYTAVVQADLALWAMLEGRLEDALTHIKRAAEWDPNYARGVQRQVALHGLRGERQAAARAIERLAKLGHAFDRTYVEASYPFRNPAHKATFLTGLSQAGLNL